VRGSSSTPTLWDDGTEPTLSVAEIGEVLGAALRRAFPDEVWVRGEIRNLKRGSTGMVWFDLVEPHPGPDLGRPPLATLPVVLFDAARRRVNAQLRQAGGAVRMESGTEVRIRGRVGFWAPGGRLQLQMSEIDPAFTLGRLAADRQRLLRLLEAEGLLDRQSRLEFPLVPLRLGLVTSAGSAADHDVMDELTASGIGFRVRRADTRVQGRSAPRSVAAALRRLATATTAPTATGTPTATGAGPATPARPVDVILLVRGGGSATDLAAFDSELLARTIAELPVPVVTGIGHDVDRTVADEVAHTSYKTPTACAQAIVAQVRAFDQDLTAAWRDITAAARVGLDAAGERLRTCARHVALGTRHGLNAAETVLASGATRLGRSADTTLARSARQLDRATGRVEAGARVHLQGHHRHLDAQASRLAQRAPRLVESHARTLEGVDAHLRALDPRRALERGWSITRREGDGALVRSTADVAPGDELVTLVADGTIGSTVRAGRDGDPDGGPDRAPDGTS
jgi:exodeoxyribonuclease VII large subunit